MTIEFKLMGTFLFRSGEDAPWMGLDAISANIGKKQRSFLLYLLLHHLRPISYEELIRQFWNTDGKDPGNALRGTLHKTRQLLRAMFPTGEELLLTQNGSLVWNKDVTLSLDVEELERLYARFQSPEEGDDRIRAGLHACELYNGDVFPGGDQEWQYRTNVYYLNLYLDLCTALSGILSEEARWGEVTELCRRAQHFAPEVEELACALLNALIMDGKPELAIRHYESYQKLLWDEFEIAPSERVEGLYALAAKHNHSDEYERELIAQITRSDDLRQAFSCSLPVFRNLVNLEMRSMGRSGHDSSLVILQLGSAAPRDIQRMERTLLQNLRAGDSLTRLNADRFVILLPGASAENAGIAMTRVLGVYGTLYPRSAATVRYRAYPIIVRNEGRFAVS